MTDHAPPFLDDVTPQQAQQNESIHCLTAIQILHLPDGTITVFNERWKAGKRLAEKNV
jgi:hypothetical protein